MTSNELEESLASAEQILHQAINEENSAEFAVSGYISTEGLNNLLYAIRNNSVYNIVFCPVAGIDSTYKMSWEHEGHNYCFLNGHQKSIIENTLQEIAVTDLRYEEEFNISPLTEEEQALLDQAVEEAHQEIPVNSATLLVDNTTSRFSSAIWYEKIQEKTIILAGCGGIGSFVGLLLARMRPTSLFIYDDDIVEAVNMSGQLYGQNDIGAAKVTALARMVRNYADYGSVFAISERFTSECEPVDIMICGFDNMEARKVFFSKWVEHVHSKSDEKKADCLFIDGRLAAEEFQVLCIKGDDTFNIERYQNEYLFTDLEADETICSYKQTTFCANMIASYMVNLFVNFCANQCNPIIDRDLPFLTTYNAETMFLKTEA